MEDDAEKCGYPTQGGDGPPCEHPATDGDSCWIDAHGGDADPGGRPNKFTDERAEDAIQAAREGFSKAGCARAAGVTPPTLNNWLDANPDYDGGEFLQAFTRARHKGERVLLQGALYDEPEEQQKHTRTVNDQHARFLLSTSFDYVKTERKELTGEDGGAIEVDSDVVTVTEATDE